MPTDNQRLDVAVFIDFENVYVSVRDKLDVNPNFEMIMDRVADHGRVVIARAYADWYRYPRVTSALYANGIEPMYVPTYYYDRDLGRTGRAIKNSVDMNLCIDAMKTLFTNPNIGKFVLATGDRDFIPLVNSIRQQGKEVIIIGVGGAASAHLAQSADEFIFYEQLIGKKPNSLTQDQPRAKMPEKGREGVESGDDEGRSERGRDRGERSGGERDRGERDRGERDRGERERSDRYRDRDREPAAPETPVQGALSLPAPVATNGTNGSAPSIPDAPAEGDEVYDTLVQAVNLARERGYVCSFGSLKLLMKELMGGDFRESRYKDPSGRPFAKFKDFALEAERRGKVQVFTSGAVNEVFLPGEDPYKLSQFAQELKEEPAPPSRETASIERGDSRGSAANGRRRRRRRGGQRTGAGELESTTADGELGADEDGEFSDADAEALAGGETQAKSDEVFEALLDRLEAEHLRGKQLADIDPMTILDEPVREAPAEPETATPAAETVVESLAAETPAAAPSPPARPEPADVVAVPFNDEEWAALRETVASSDRPLSFQQIHDRLRTARNTGGVGRTNEELRTLIKQAINSGMLERLGKGARATYRLAAPTDADQTELIAPAVDTEVAEAPPELRLPEAEPATLIVETAPEPTAEEPAAPAKKPRSRARKKPAEAAAEPVAEVAAEPVAEAAPEPVVKAAPEPAAEAPAEEAAPKRTRRRRKAADPAAE